MRWKTLATGTAGMARCELEPPALSGRGAAAPQLQSNKDPAPRWDNEPGGVNDPALQKMERRFPNRPFLGKHSNKCFRDGIGEKFSSPR